MQHFILEEIVKKNGENKKLHNTEFQWQEQ